MDRPSSLRAAALALLVCGPAAAAGLSCDEPSRSFVANQCPLLSTSGTDVYMSNKVVCAGLVEAIEHACITTCGGIRPEGCASPAQRTAYNNILSLRAAIRQTYGISTPRQPLTGRAPARRTALAGSPSMTDAETGARVRAEPPLSVPPPTAASLDSALQERNDDGAARDVPALLGTQAHINLTPTGMKAISNMDASLLIDVGQGLMQRAGPGSSAPRGEQARAYTAAGGLFALGRDATSAEQAFAAAIAADPAYAPAYQARGETRLASGDGPGAAADFARALELEPDNAQARRMLGAAQQLQEGKARIGRMRVGFEEKEDAPELPAGAGADDAAAVAAPARRTAVDPTAGWPVQAVALSPQAQAALTSDPMLRAMAALAPTDLASRPLLERQQWTALMEAVARRQWRQALEPASWLVDNGQGRDVATLLLRAKIGAALGNWKGVEADAKRAIALAPEDPGALLELGYALLRQGQAAEGLALIERSLALRPTGLGELYRAEALEALGRKAEAIAAYKAARALDPVLGPLVQAALARLDPAGAAEEKKGRGLPPWRRTLAVVAALVAGLLALKGAHAYGLLGGRQVSERAATAFAAAAPGREPALGDIIGGHFQVDKELARGGMGVVYLATDTVLQRPVAIKRLNADAYASEDARRKFVQEAQLAARLKHPNLAAIHSVFGEQELYLVFEFVEGESLDAVLARRGRLPLPEVRRVVSEVCAALAHAHAGRVIHRDLKPANVMLAPDGSCKILDFGIAHEARTVSSATRTQAWGTPPYMAPEQEDGYVSPASDLYSVAVMAYELLAGRRPFEGANQLGLKRSASFPRLGGQHGLPPELDRFFARALNPDPAQRFARAADLAQALNELAGTPVRS